MDSLRRSAYWIIILISITLLAIIWLGFSTVANTTDFVQSERELSDAYNTKHRVEEHLSAIKDAEIGQRDFLLTADDRFLKQYEMGVLRIERTAEQVRLAIFEEPDSMVMFEDMEQRVSKLRGELANAIASRQTVSADGSRSSLISERGSAEMSSIRALAGKLLEQQDERLTQLQQISQDRAAWTRSEIVGGHALAAILLGLAAVTIYVDRKTRTAYEAMLREQAAILTQIQDAVHIRDAEGRISYWNHGCEQLYGWMKEEIVGRTADQFMAPTVLPEHLAAKAAQDSQGSWIGEIKQVTKSGREILVEQRRTMLHDSMNKVAGELIISIDISQRQQNELIERRRQRLESVGTLAGGIAHDLNNVLTPIMMASTLLESDQIPEKRQRLTRTIRLSAERGAEMIKQLLAFAGGQKTERKTIELGQTVLEVQELLKHTLQKNIHVVCDIQADLWPVRGDTTEISQVLINLSVNARDAMPAGGQLAIIARNVTLYSQTQFGVRTLEPGRFVQLTLQDNGQGIPSQIIDRVFDPFFTTKEQGKGTGLGLATCLGIIHSYGGAISVNSREGDGAEFTIMLAADQESQTNGLLNEVPQKPLGRGEIILVVDDEMLVAEMARDTLEQFGYQVMVADGGQAALDILSTQGNRINVILIDMMMPDMDGPTTIRAIQDADLDIPIVTCSGLREVSQTHLPGVVDFIPKPYSDQQLLLTIRHAIDLFARVAASR